MSYEPKARFKIEYGTKRKIAQGVALICSPPANPTVERLNALKAQLLAFFLCLERPELSSPDTKAQSLRIQKELSMLIWTLEDWQFQLASRN
jgi:hypothetical protein